MEMSADIAKAMNSTSSAAFVSEVLPNSGSAKAGIKSGDVIVSLNGKPLNTPNCVRASPRPSRAPK
jgi:serine protease DegQ